MMFKEIQELDLCALNKAKVEELLEQVPSGDYKVMDELTFCLFDLTPYEIPKFRTLLIQRNGMVYKSRTPTNQLLEKFALSFNHEHQQTCLVAETLGFHKKVPYVIGERGIIPLDGYSKQPVTWVVANNAAHVSYDTKQNTVSLITGDRFALTLEVSKAIFDEQLKRTAQILRVKCKMHEARMKEYNYCFQIPIINPRNILFAQCEKLRYEEPDYTYFEVDQKVRQHMLTKDLKKVLGEGNPYFDDYLAKVQLN